MPQIRAAPSPHLQIERLLKQVSQPGSKQTLRVQEPFTRRDATNPTQSNAHEHCAFAGTLYQARLYYSHTTQCTQTLRVGKNPFPSETLLFPHNAMHTNNACRQEPFTWRDPTIPTQCNAHEQCVPAGTLYQARLYYSHTTQCTRTLRVGRNSFPGKTLKSHTTQCTRTMRAGRNPLPGETLLFPHNAMHTNIARRQEPFPRRNSTIPTQCNAHEQCVPAGTLYQARLYYSHTTQCTQTLRVGRNPSTRRDTTIPTQRNAHKHCASAGTLSQAKLYYSHTTQCTQTLRVGRNPSTRRDYYSHNAMHTNIARRQEPFPRRNTTIPTQCNAHEHCVFAGTLSQARLYYSHTTQCTRLLRVGRNPFPGKTLLIPHKAMHTNIVCRQEPFTRQDATNPTQRKAHKHCASAGTLYQARHYDFHTTQCIQTLSVGRFHIRSKCARSAQYLSGSKAAKHRSSISLFRASQPRHSAMVHHTLA